MKDIVSFDDFAKVDLRVGLVERAENLENSEKLIRLTVDFADDGKKNVLTGLRQWYVPEDFEGGYFVFVLNLEPKSMAGEMSEGMLLCVDGEKPLPVKAPDGSRAGITLK
ncbi:MAG: methionine--tRNA ligase [bacterium]|nr:methionine--tRNA ligase [bacterium]